MTEAQAREQGFKVKVGKFPFQGNGKAIALDDFEGMVKLVVDEEFGEAFGRSYGGVVKEYQTDDADLVILAMGTVASESRVAIDILREKGHRVGVASLRLYRPFPTETIRRLATTFKKIMVIDRAVSYGNEGPLAGDTKAALYGVNDPVELRCFIAGIGGREITAEMIADAAESVLTGEAESPAKPQHMPWINLQPAHSTLTEPIPAADASY